METLKKHEVIILSEEEAFAVYRMPGARGHVLIRGNIVSEMPAQGGFVIQKFDKKTKPPSIIAVNELIVNPQFSFDTTSTTTVVETPLGEYMNYANETIDEIRCGKFQKVVLSRRKKVFRNGNSLFDLFIGLKDLYPDAFVFLYHLPEGGTWIGATPEILLENANNCTITMALAGTQADQGIPMDQVEWGDKEREEQQIIERYIEDILIREGHDFSKTGPVTTKAGRVLHLLTIFRIFELEDPFELSDRLHPGPAICGLPLQDALFWIKEKEGYDREHYCGYLGPWNIQDQKSLYINLRSMQVFKNAYLLYLGGGLTADSIASSEWTETELKAETMLAAIEKLTIS